MPSLLGFSILIIPIQSKNLNAIWESMHSSSGWSFPVLVPVLLALDSSLPELSPHTLIVCPHTGLWPPSLCAPGPRTFTLHIVDAQSVLWN